MDWIFEQIKSFLWLFVVAVKKASRIISLLSCLAKLLGKWQTAFVMRVRFIYMPYQVHFSNSILCTLAQCLASYLGDLGKFSMFFPTVFQASTGKKLWGKKHGKFHGPRNLMLHIPLLYKLPGWFMGSIACDSHYLEVLEFNSGSSK